MADVGFQNGTIRLEQIPAVYYAGQIINGSIVFDLRQPLNFSAIYIQYLGEANVLWSYMEYETINGVKRSREIKYQGHEEYFNYTETLEIAGGNGTTQLSPTRHELPFKYQLPFTCPSTFKGQKGSIRYTITATLVYPDMRREELRTEFNVVSPLDLNTGNPALKEPINLELEELNPCNWCCSTDAVTVRLQLPVTGYCPGQAIPVSVEVDNNSSVEISKMTFEIATRELYRSGQPPSEHVVPGPTLVSVEKGPVLVGNKRNFTHDMVVPNFIVPYLEHCSIIDLGYFFKATIVLSGCNDDMQDEAEICLGLVPLKETLTSEYRHPMADSLPPGPIPIPPFHGSHNSVNRSQQNLAPGPYPPYHGSHNSLNRSQNNLNQNLGPVPYPYPGSQNNLNRSQNNLNNPPPYPGNNESYPSEKKDPNIGFRTNSPYPLANVMPGAGVPPYPLANVMPGAGVPPYPSSNLMPGASPPAYPAVNSPQGGNLPPYPGGNPTQGGSFPPYQSAPPSGQGFAPSAPPALD